MSQDRARMYRSSSQLPKTRTNTSHHLTITLDLPKFTAPIKTAAQGLGGRIPYEPRSLFGIKGDKTFRVRIT